MSENETVTPEPKKSDLSARVITAVPLAVVVVGMLIYGSTTVVGVAALIFALVGISEYNTMFAKNYIHLNPLLLMGCTLLMGIGSLVAGVSGLTSALVFSALIVFFYQLLFMPLKDISELQVLGLDLFGLLWIGWSFNHFALIKDLPEGTALVFLLLITIWVSDSFAYFGGKRFGKTPLAPSISPKKTIEGSACGAIGSGVIGGIFAFTSISALTWWQGFLISIFIALIGQMGDLIESKLKRLCDVKDSGTIIPGHGGVLDRVDGLLTTVPAFYYIVWMIINAH
ncbi:phosphatidate cytidylyltransferase [Deltaproteobacteria bacterium TL4]